MTIIVCEQCNGTGWIKRGQRCPCREEDDEAERRRKKIKLIYSLEIQDKKTPRK